MVRAEFENAIIALCNHPSFEHADLTPNQVANMAPKMNWPWPPMLNRPALKAIAMPRETMISGVATVMVSVMGLIMPSKLAAS